MRFLGLQHREVIFQVFQNMWKPCGYMFQLKKSKEPRMMKNKSVSSHSYLTPYYSLQMFDCSLKVFKANKTCTFPALFTKTKQNKNIFKPINALALFLQERTRTDHLRPVRLGGAAPCKSAFQGQTRLGRCGCGV